ncbi:hypothetical protein ACIGXM_03465 [Kitasatospora sp. NPDC052896]|uniref:hypothetical protein n=1 Tax=Kitasatospora sp. NPDC052896 TaxID=3364061 RepID=UPI0037C53FAC
MRQTRRFTAILTAALAMSACGIGSAAAATDHHHKAHASSHRDYTEYVEDYSSSDGRYGGHNHGGGSEGDGTVSIGYEVRTAMTGVPLVGSFAAVAQCSPGKRVLGGGYTTNGVTVALPLTAEGPTPLYDGWYVSGVAVSAGGTVTVYAICASV